MERHAASESLRELRGLIQGRTELTLASLEKINS